MFEFQNIMKWIIPAAVVVGGFLVGLIFEKIIIKKLKSISLKTK